MMKLEKVREQKLQQQIRENRYKTCLVKCYFCRSSDSVRKILGNYAEFPGGHIMRQKRSIILQIMQFLWRRFHIEHNYFHEIHNNIEDFRGSA